MKVFGYLDRLSARPGDELACMTSSTAGPVTIDVVRLIHGDENPAGPGFRAEPVPQVPEVRVPGRVQQIWIGSCVRADGITPGEDLSLEVLAWPTTPELGRTQGVIGATDERGQQVAGITIGADGHPELRGRDGALLAHSARKLLERQWYRLEAEFAPDGARLTVTSLRPIPGEELPDVVTGEAAALDGATRILAAASTCPDDEGRPRPQDVYNGKLEHPVVRSGGTAIAEWAFEHDLASDRAKDISGHGRDGELLNLPARAMTGHAWTGEYDDPADAPDQYGAIHFHDDDLADAGWEADATIELPEGTSSGVYAVRLRVETEDGEETDHIPFSVLPRTPQAKVAYLIPTFTYVAYANERLLHRLDYEEAGITDHPITPGIHDRTLAEHPEFGSSLYDHHSDGSGVCYSTHLRPILNLRPDYRMWLQNAPRHLGADLYVVDWLERHDIAYDVITDHDLHAEGADLLAGYQVVVTGSHPEYHSGRMLDAFDAHMDAGGCLMYLGGNGFYWVTTPHPARPEALEVRRSTGIRTWEAQPGEQRHSATGEPGGLWRRRGRSPNRLTGVGMCSQGWDRKAPAFERTPLSYEPEWAWVFDGIDDQLIGDFGLIMDGTSGDELDRFDPSHGSPPNTAILATSQRHSDYYQLAVEDVLMLSPGLGGSECNDVRSDMVVVERTAGGAVFSVGSICFTGALSWNGYANNVSRLVHNVLTDFIERDSKRPAQTEGDRP